MVLLLPLPPKVSNIIVKTKISAFDPKNLPACISQEYDVKHFSNYLSLRLTTFTLVVFPSSGHVNVTGIASFAQIGHIKALVENLFAQRIHKLSIVSSTASGHILCLFPPQSRLQQPFECRYPLDYKKWYALSQRLQAEYSFTFRRGLFPSVIVRNVSDDRGWSGCIQVFKTGSYNVVGCRSKTAIRRAVSTLRWLLQQSQKME